MDDQAKAAVRKEVLDFYSGFDPFETEDQTAGEIIDLFLQRNHVVRLPEHGELVVTEEQHGGPEGREYTSQLINGRVFASNADPFYWQRRIQDGEKDITDAEDELKSQILMQAQRRAVLTYLTEKAAKVTQYEAERQERRDALVREFLPGSKWDGLLKWVRDLINRLLDAEDARDSVKP